MAKGILCLVKIGDVVVWRREWSVSRPTVISSVIGGSLDGAVIPSGTYDGQRLVWDSRRQRWIGMPRE